MSPSPTPAPETSSFPPPSAGWKRIVPLALAAGLLIGSFQGVEWPRLWASLIRTELRIVLPCLILNTLVFALVDALSFTEAYRWMFPHLQRREMMRLRLAALLPQTAIASLAGVFSLLYLYRRHRASPLRGASGMLFIILGHGMGVGTSLLVGLSLGAAAIPRFWLLYPAGVFGLALLGWLSAQPFFQPYVLPPLRRAQLLVAFRSAPAWRYGWAMALRAPIVLAEIGLGWMALRGMGLDIPPAALLVAVPMNTVVATLPISPGGLGGPQAALLHFLGSFASRESLLAFSLIWSVGFTLGRAAIGLVFFPRAWRRMTWPIASSL